MRVKADGEFVRRQNRLLLVEALRRHGPQARTELGRKTGLSPATVTSITGDLLAEGLLTGHGDESTARSGPGRPLQRLTLNGLAASVLGIEISIDTVSFIFASYDGRIIDRRVRREPTQRVTAAAFGKRLSADVRTVLRRNKAMAGPVQRIGVSVQGIANSARGTIAWSPAFRARDIAIVAPLESALGVETSISNDTNLAAQALLRRHPEAYSGTAAVVFIGYGVGMGLIIDGSVYAGPNGAAAEFGHMNHLPDGPLCRCGQRGCVEAFASDYGIYRAASGQAPASEPPHAAIAPSAMAAIEARARAGDPLAKAAFREAGLALGYGLARAIALVELERVALMGSGLTAFDLLEPALRHGLARGLPVGLQRDVPIEVEPSNNNLMTDGLLDSLLGDIDRRRSARVNGPALQGGAV